MTLASDLINDHAIVPDAAFQPIVTAPKTVKSRAFGKTIIVGEHAVVYGARAVAMPVFSVQMNVELRPALPVTPQAEPTVRVTLGGRSVTEHLRGVVDDAFDCLGIKPFDLDLDGHSSVLVGAGLGSSASLCVVVLRALAASTGRILGKKELSDMANMLEKRFHGNPSGLDTAVVAWEEVITFAKGSTPAPVTLQSPRSGPWRFAVLDSKARSSTLAMVQNAAPFFKGTSGDAHIRRFDLLAQVVAQGLSSGDDTILAEAMTEAGAHLASAGIVSAPLAELIQIAQDAGALAAKVTGAGGGGCVLALLDSQSAESQVARLRSQLGSHRVFDVELA
jgi:mevalonate kinase